MTPFFCWYILESVNRGSGGAIMASAIMENFREFGTPIDQLMASAAEWPSIRQSGDLIFRVAKNQLIDVPFEKWLTWKWRSFRTFSELNELHRIKWIRRIEYTLHENELNELHRIAYFFISLWTAQIHAKTNTNHPLSHKRYRRFLRWP